MFPKRPDSRKDPLGWFLNSKVLVDVHRYIPGYIPNIQGLVIYLEPYLSRYPQNIGEHWQNTSSLVLLSNTRPFLFAWIHILSGHSILRFVIPPIWWFVLHAKPIHLVMDLNHSNLRTFMVYIGKTCRHMWRIHGFRWSTFIMFIPHLYEFTGHLQFMVSFGITSTLGFTHTHIYIYTVLVCGTNGGMTPRLTKTDHGVCSWTSYARMCIRMFVSGS